MILYLHGFRSSPLSFKARLLAERLTGLGIKSAYLCPQLPASPHAAIALAQTCIGQTDLAELTIIGSSLGDFYATWLAEQIGCRAALLNPAVRPPCDLEKYIGMHTQYHSDARFEFKREYIAELEALVIARIMQPQRYFLIAAKGDEVLDWHEMMDHYPHAQQLVMEGSYHGISEFSTYADALLAFCGVDLDASPAGC
ncbi:MAG: esterase [Glaciimonas sp.]|nr:esterase [Glaciimonas sp.]